MHKRKGRVPDCENCLPALLPENEDAFRVYRQCCSQYILGMGGPVDVNHLAVWKYIEMYEIESPLECFETVIATCRHMIGLANEKNRAEREGA